ncbi:hypothetical protein GCM10027341_05860 [Spirosoma knui]
MIAWKESAKEEVRDIYTYLLDQSVALAEEWLNELEKKLELIERSPGMGRIVPDFNISFICEVFVGRYRIVYSTQEDTLKILAVRHQASQLGKL